MKTIFDFACVVIATITVLVYGLAATEHLVLFMYVGIVLGGTFLVALAITVFGSWRTRARERPHIIKDSWKGRSFIIGTDFVTRSYAGMYKYDHTERNFVATLLHGDLDPADNIRVSPEYLGIDPNDLP